MSTPKKIDENMPLQAESDKVQATWFEIVQERYLKSSVVPSDELTQKFGDPSRSVYMVSGKQGEGCRATQYCEAFLDSDDTKLGCGM